MGYGIDKLTQGGAGHLKAAASVDAIRTRIAAARQEGVERLDARRTQAAPRKAGAALAVEAGATGAEGADSVLETVEGLEREQRAMIEAAPIEQTYQETLALHVQAKHAQVERVEERLELLIDRQQARLQQTQAQQPGILSLPVTKRAWQNQQAQQQSRLQTLHVRLEAVREIKDGMGIHEPKLEELATRKMRAESPELASDWDAMREAARRHHMMQRKQEQERKQTQEQRQGRSQSLGLNRN